MNIQSIKNKLTIALNIYLRDKDIELEDFASRNIPKELIAVNKAVNDAFSGIDVITVQLQALEKNIEHDHHGEIENVIFDQFQCLIDKSESFEDDTQKATCSERYHILIHLIANDLAQTLFVRSSLLDKLQESRIKESNEQMNDKGEATDYFDFKGMDIHDPTTDESTTCDVDPIKYYGLSYLAWYNKS